MKTSQFLFAAASLAFLPYTAGARIERRVEKTFSVQPGGTLTLDTRGGDIRIKAGADQQVHVVAIERIHADSEARADELLKDLTLTIGQSGNDVSALAKYEKRPAGFHWGSWPPVEVGFEVTVPAAFNASVHTSGGDVAIGDLAGKVDAHTSGGDIALGRIDGTVRAQTSGGDVHLEQATGPANLGTSGGNIVVGRVLGPVEAGTSGGDIRVEAVEGRLTAETSGGDITAGLHGTLGGDCVLATSGGDIRVTVDRGAAFALDASTSGGEVKAEGLTVTIERGGPGKSRLAGSVNGGGPRLKLRTSGGDISIRPN